MFLRLSCLLKCLSTLRRVLWAMETTSVAVDETRFYISQCPRSCRRRDIIYKTIEHFWIKAYWHITEILTRRFSERSDDDSSSHCFLLLYIYKCRPLQRINVFSGFFRSFFSFVAPILAQFLRFYMLRWHIAELASQLMRDRFDLKNKCSMFVSVKGRIEIPKRRNCILTVISLAIVKTRPQASCLNTVFHLNQSPNTTQNSWRTFHTRRTRRDWFFVRRVPLLMWIRDGFQRVSRQFGQLLRLFWRVKRRSSSKNPSRPDFTVGRRLVNFVFRVKTTDDSLRGGIFVLKNLVCCTVNNISLTISAQKLPSHSTSIQFCFSPEK